MKQQQEMTVNILYTEHTQCTVQKLSFSSVAVRTLCGTGAGTVSEQIYTNNVKYMQIIFLALFSEQSFSQFSKPFLITVEYF
jgi:hypothetical protein